jgi:hypothetical protein
VVMQPDQPPTLPEASGPPPTGAIEDSTAHRLAVGMSDMEVFTIAGPPKYPVRDLNSAARWVYQVGDELLEITFGSGRIISIKRLNPESGIAR